MRQAGGLIALMAGVLGVALAAFTLLVGGCGAALESEGSELVLGLGAGGVVFSFGTIVLGAVVLFTRRRWPGVLLIPCALLGAVLGGTFVAVAMVLALVGGLLAAIGGAGAPRVRPGEQ